MFIHGSRYLFLENTLYPKLKWVLDLFIRWFHCKIIHKNPFCNGLKTTHFIWKIRQGIQFMCNLNNIIDVYYFYLYSLFATVVSISSVDWSRWGLLFLPFSFRFYVFPCGTSLFLDWTRFPLPLIYRIFLVPRLIKVIFPYYWSHLLIPKYDLLSQLNFV